MYFKMRILLFKKKDGKKETRYSNNKNVCNKQKRYPKT